MAASSVMLPESLRVWKAAGLRHVLVQGGPRPGTCPEPAPASSPASSVEWPPPWDRFLERVGRPSHSIWTYFALGEDLGGKPDPERRTVLKQIISALAWPEGSISFWPLAVLEGGRLCEDMALFRRGVEYAGACHAVCFGEEGFRLLCPDSAFTPGEHDCPALPSIRSLLALPDLNALSQDRPDIRGRALSLLRAIAPA